MLTVAPASQQTGAAALSSKMARGRNKPERGQDARRVSKGIKATPARASGGDQRQLKPQAAEQQHTEGSGLELEFRRSGQCCKAFGSEQT